MKKSKSQITMMIIIGLVLFIAVSLVLYLSKYAIKKQSEKGIKSSFTQESQSVKEFVSQCLDKLSKDAIILLSKQGGYIYTSQGGTLLDFNQVGDKGYFFVNYNDGDREYNVPYTIIPLRFDISPYQQNPPEYPWLYFPYETATSTVGIFNGIFGLNGMPPLEKSQGPQSIQRQIEHYIDKKMPSCLDFSSFEAEGFEIKKEEDVLKTTVVIGSKDISIKSEIPIVIKNQRTKETTELNDFSTNLQIRLKDAYMFARALVQNDIGNIKFDIDAPANDVNDLSISLSKDVLDKDDIIIVKDKKSLVYGKPFEYVFARKNRIPALYRYNTPLTFASGTEITELNLLQGSRLNAEDPDEDSLVFTITPSLPYVVNSPVSFKIEVSDASLVDYQEVAVTPS